ncbi:MAG: glycosyltransferase family 4 protein [Pseudomonas sp.]|uniref:glycosyltransferase family 4 protein n=1 Tax=Pseudomonas sp. TaxID=306 RepID=UPI00339348FB
MRILLLVETLGIGGLPNYVLALARALTAHGDQVAVAHASLTLPAHLDTAGLELLRLASEPLTTDRGATEALRRMHAWQPTLVHVHLCSALALLEALPRLEVPLLRSFHDYSSLCLRRGRRRFPGDRCQRPLGWSCLAYGCGIAPPLPGGYRPGLANLPGKLRERALYREFAMAVVGSQHMRQVLLLNGFAAEKVHVLPYFSRFDRQALGYGGPPDDALADAPAPCTLRLLFAGQAIKGKGLEVLLRALARVQGAWQLKAVAAGPRLSQAKSLAQRLGIAAQVDFIEWVPQDQLASYYRWADLFVLPSIWDDPGPLVGIESLSFATPVLAFPVGGIADYVLHDVTGWLTEHASTDSLALWLQHALAERARLPGLGQAGRVLVTHQHTREAHVARLHRLYESLPIWRPLTWGAGAE